MSNSIALIPDVHGRSFWRSILNNADKFDKIIFLGDYSDPYSYEGFTHDDAIRELTDIVQFKKDNPDKVVLLLGNHDLSYVDASIFCPCRYSQQHKQQYKDLISRQLDLYQICYEFEQAGQYYFCTHAGVSQDWINYNKGKFITESDIALMLERTFEVNKHIFGQISRFRGGDYEWGSPVWADLGEHWMNSPFEHGIQISAHQQQRDAPKIMSKHWCLDCRKIFILENGTLKEYTEESCCDKSSSINGCGSNDS